ncbi:hypothetical protein [Novosphingobium sp. MBES04]|uniref:hypothetical protein n=1 Tax=Novosphingobium sp. MBES04 TaxID=1206458 RepID=UPI00057DF075|nr:hypothetical protein [Novosphingobium sp. MBES04]
MPKPARKTPSLAAIENRRAALRSELAALDQQAREAHEAARDAGRDTLLAALERVRISAMGKADARAIARAIATHDAGAITQKLSELEPSSAA